MSTPSPVSVKYTRKLEFSSTDPQAARTSLRRQWLVTNGLGGYASGTLAGAVTWRYHGLLIAALPAPVGRMVMLNHLAEFLRRPDGTRVQFGGAEPGPAEHATPLFLREFRLEHHLPVWRYEIDGIVIEKRILMPYLQNTAHVSYRRLDAGPAWTLELRPSVHFRRIEDSAGVALPAYGVRVRGRRLEIEAADIAVPLRLFIATGEFQFTQDGGSTREIFYERDAERGYEARGLLWSPGYLTAPLASGEAVTLVASTEDWHTASALDPDAALSTEVERRQHLARIAVAAAQQGLAAELVLAADQFLVSPAGRIADAARARAAGDELRSVIAGYHWFTDWGRDTMISLEGLALTTGRWHEAAWILRTFARAVRDGLVPNLFPEGKNDGLYHTADASLWFFHAAHRYFEITGDAGTLDTLLPVLRDIAEHHLRGTHFGIGVDPSDGLLRQGAEGYQLTWMDAKVGDWVVTPRRGKAVEINALWYNALKLLETWLRRPGPAGDPTAADIFARHAARCRDAFNRRFWNPARDCLFDVVDGEKGDDPSVRPNQIIAISLPHPVLDAARWAAVLGVVEKQLLTPVGLRSLSRDHPDYKERYYGDLRSRDAAYHQGTVWAWLIGPFVDAWLKVHDHDLAGARRLLTGFGPRLDEACVSTISEIFDAEEPFTPRGCIAQAWSVAEVLRCLVLTAPR